MNNIRLFERADRVETESHFKVLTFNYEGEIGTGILIDQRSDGLLEVVVTQLEKLTVSLSNVISVATVNNKNIEILLSDYALNKGVLNVEQFLVRASSVSVREVFC